jgi:hypothetical protein
LIDTVTLPVAELEGGVGAAGAGAGAGAGGFEFQSLGDTPEAFNAGDQSKVIGTIGIGFSY